MLENAFFSDFRTPDAALPKSVFNAKYFPCIPSECLPLMPHRVLRSTVIDVADGTFSRWVGTTYSLLKYIRPLGALSVPCQFFLGLLSLSVSRNAPPWFPSESRGVKYALMPQTVLIAKLKADITGAISERVGTCKEVLSLTGPALISSSTGSPLKIGIRWDFLKLKQPVPLVKR